MKRVQYIIGAAVLAGGATLGAILLHPDHKQENKVVNVPLQQPVTGTTTDDQPADTADPVQTDTAPSTAPVSTPNDSTPDTTTPAATPQASVPVYYVPTQASGQAISLPVQSNGQ